MTRVGTLPRAVPVEKIKAIVAEQFNDEIDENTAEVLSELMDDMMDSILDWSVKVADAKGTNILDVEDVRFICEQEWGISMKETGVGVKK
jgi:transcription initiation factor TFIID subunit TAF12